MNRIIRRELAELVQKRVCQLYRRVSPAFYPGKVCETGSPKAAGALLHSALGRFFVWVFQGDTSSAR